MTAPVMASERDLRTLAGIVSDHRADLPVEGLSLSLLADLKTRSAAIRCRSLASTGRQADWFEQAIEAIDDLGPRTWSGRTGSSTGTANSAATPTVPAICAPS